MAISRPGSGGGGYGPGPRLGAVKKAPKAKGTSSNKKAAPKSYGTSNPKIAKSKKGMGR